MDKRAMIEKLKDDAEIEENRERVMYLNPEYVSPLRKLIREIEREVRAS